MASSSRSNPPRNDSGLNGGKHMLQQTSTSEKKLLHYTGKAIADFNMIAHGDRVMLLVYCQERDIITYAKEQAFSIIPCNLCGSQENLVCKRVARLIQDLAQENPKIPSNMLHALSNVNPSQLMDKKLWDFT